MTDAVLKIGDNNLKKLALTQAFYPSKAERPREPEASLQLSYPKSYPEKVAPKSDSLVSKIASETVKFPDPAVFDDNHDGEVNALDVVVHNQNRLANAVEVYTPKAQTKALNSDSGLSLTA